MRKVVVVGVALAMLGLAVGVVAPASSGETYRRVTLRLTEKAADNRDHQAFVDVGREGPSVADYVVISQDPIFDARRARQVGDGRGDCVAVRAREAPAGPPELTLECDVTFVLAGGLITTEGPFAPAGGRSVVAVTGGTGPYRAAHGTMTAINEEAGFTFVFRLLL